MEKMCRIEKKYLKNAYIANTLVWMLILCLPYLSHGSDVSNLSFTDYLLLLRLPVTVIILFYVDYYFLVDRYLLKDRILPFIGINLILILFLLALERMTAFPLKDAGAIRDFPAPPMVIFVSAFGRYESSTDAPNWNVIFFQYLRTSYLPGVQLSPKTRLFLSL